MNSILTDKLGIGISAICMIHCLISPILIAFVGTNTIFGSMHGAFDVVILLIALSIMLLSLKSLRNTPFFPYIIAVVLAGALLFISSFFMPQPYNHLLFVLGSGTWFSAHFYNLKRHSIKK